jgi:integrase
MLDRRWHRAIEAFLRHERAGSKSEQTIQARRHQLEHLARNVSATPWHLTVDELRDFVASKDWAKETRRGRRTTYVRFYAWALAEGFVTENIAERLPKVPSSMGKPRPAPDRAYHEALLAAHPREALMLRLAAEVGMRRAEVAKVHTDDLVEDFVDYSLVVHGKGDKDRVVPLPRSLGEAIAGAPSGYLFPGDDDGHLSPRYVGKLIARLLPDGFTMHTLRHRFATRLYASRRDILLVQAMLGHASVGTTQRYVEFDHRVMRDAVEDLAANDQPRKDGVA